MTFKEYKYKDTEVKDVPSRRKPRKVRVTISELCKDEEGNSYHKYRCVVLFFPNKTSVDEFIKYNQHVKCEVVA